MTCFKPYRFQPSTVTDFQISKTLGAALPFASPPPVDASPKIDQQQHQRTLPEVIANVPDNHSTSQQQSLKRELDEEASQALDLSCKKPRCDNGEESTGHKESPPNGTFNDSFGHKPTPNELFSTMLKSKLER